MKEASFDTLRYYLWIQAEALTVIRSDDRNQNLNGRGEKATETIRIRNFTDKTILLCISSINGRKISLIFVGIQHATPHSVKKRKRKLRLPTLTQNPTQHKNEGRILCPNLSWYVCGDSFNKHISRGGANLPYQSKTSWQPLAIHWDRRQHPLVVHHGLHFYDSYHHMAVPFVEHDRWHHFYDRSGLGVVLNPWYLSLVCILLFGFLFQTIGTKKKNKKKINNDKRVERSTQVILLRLFS